MDYFGPRVAGGLKPLLVLTKQMFIVHKIRKIAIIKYFCITMRLTL